MMTQLVEFDLDFVHLEGSLNLPLHAHGVVAFAHGSGSSRHNSRNHYVSQALQAIGLGTLLFDLLTPEEEQADMQTALLRFNISLLARRLMITAEWLAQYPPTASLPLGLFGASTGGAAALLAAAEHPDRVHAVVSRGGRPDLAGPALARIRAPTLFIVGENDLPVIQLNEEAFSHLTCERKLEIIPGATHLFEEPGALAEVARLAAHWFEQHLSPVAV